MGYYQAQQRFENIFQSWNCDEIVEFLEKNPSVACSKMFLNLYGNNVFAESTFPLKAILLIPSVTLAHIKTVHSLIDERSLKRAAGTNTMLHYACRNPKPEIIDFLLDKEPSAAIQVRKRNGYLPICYLLDRCTMETKNCCSRLLSMTPDDLDAISTCLNIVLSKPSCPLSIREQVVERFLDGGFQKLRLFHGNFRYRIAEWCLVQKILPRLEHLELVRVSWTGDAWSLLMSSLQENRSIGELHLRFPSTGKGNDLVDLIRCNHKISWLLADNAKGVNGEAFAKALAENRGLQVLTCCTGCSFSPIPSDDLALGNAVGCNKVLRKLRVSGWQDKADRNKAEYLARLNGPRHNILQGCNNATLASLVAELFTVRCGFKKYEGIRTSLQYDCLLEFSGVWSKNFAIAWPSLD